MGLIRFARTYRSLGRLSHILGSLTRHGFGELIDRLNLAHYVPGVKALRDLPEAGEKLTREEAMARRVRLVAEELGPTFVKLGQMLSQRPDLLSPPFLKELGRLREHVKPFPFEEVRRIVERELNGRLEDIFKEFDPACMASGSIAQVHAAVTTDGQKVVVKVKRPGIDKVVSTDIDLMMQLAQMIEKRAPELALLRPRIIVEEFAKGIRQELDFISEASLAQRFGAEFDEEDKVLVPAVFWDLTTTSVLTLERIQGVSLSDMDELDRLGVDRKELSKHLAQIFLKQFFVTGLFHADPHAGNIFICDHDVVGILDFGLMGRMTDEMKEQLGMMVIAASQGQVDVVVDIGVEVGIFGEVEHPEELRADLVAMFDRYYGMPLKLIDSRKFFMELMEGARKHHAMLPREFVLLGRSYASIEGLGRELDPDFDMRSVMDPYAHKLLMERFSPKRIFEKGRRAMWDFSRFLRTGPRKIGEFFNRLMAGKLSFSLEHKGLEAFTLELERASNRLAFAIITAALIVGSSLVLVAKVGPLYYDFPVIGIVGYCTAALLGLWLILAILRRGKL